MNAESENGFHSIISASDLIDSFRYVRGCTMYKSLLLPIIDSHLTEIKSRLISSDWDDYDAEISAVVSMWSASHTLVVRVPFAFCHERTF